MSKKKPLSKNKVTFDVEDYGDYFEVHIETDFKDEASEEADSVIRAIHYKLTEVIKIQHEADTH